MVLCLRLKQETREQRLRGEGGGRGGLLLPSMQSVSQSVNQSVFYFFYAVSKSVNQSMFCFMSVDSKAIIIRQLALNT